MQRYNDILSIYSLEKLLSTKSRITLRPLEENGIDDNFPTRQLQKAVVAGIKEAAYFIGQRSSRPYIACIMRQGTPPYFANHIERKLMIDTKHMHAICFHILKTKSRSMEAKKTTMLEFLNSFLMLFWCNHPVKAGSISYWADHKQKKFMSDIKDH